MVRSDLCICLGRILFKVDKEGVRNTPLDVFLVASYLTWNRFEPTGQNLQVDKSLGKVNNEDIAHQTNTCSKSTIETLEKCVKYVQS